MRLRLIVTSTIFICSTTLCTAQAQEDWLKGSTFDTVVRGSNTFIVEDVSEIVLVEEGNDVYVTETNHFPIPQKMNGMNIYTEQDVHKSASIDGKRLKIYLLSNIKNITSQLSDGLYVLRLQNIILSAEGKIVYYDFDGIRRYVDKSSTLKINNKIEDATERAIEQIIKNAPLYTPAYIYNNSVNCRISTEAFDKPFNVRGGIVFFD